MAIFTDDPRLGLPQVFVSYIVVSKQIHKNFRKQTIIINM